MNFICPVCSAPLKLEGRSFLCQNRHCFDRAKQGYVNLLTNGGSHGDNREMIRARRDFLWAEHYSPLADELCRAIADCALPDRVTDIVDAGCGEGYYTAKVDSYLRERGIEHHICGIDVSRDACAYAAKAVKAADFAVASVYSMPFADQSADIVTSLFAPSAPEEYIRVLRPEGKLIIALPGVRHLYGLKEILYDTPYENELSEFGVDGFTLTDRKSIAFTRSLDNQSAQALFAMTPYYYNTPESGHRRLAECDRLTTEIEFELAVYRKN